METLLSNLRANLRLWAAGVWLAVAGVAVSGAGARAEAPFDFAANPGMLPKTIVPAAYRITLVTNRSLTAFTGREAVDVDVAVATRRIVLNQAGLTISRAAIGGVVAAVVLDDAAQTVTLTFPQTLKTGRTTLAIDFAGPITGDPYGIYHDDYVTAAGVHERMLVTQFEVADARRMFPGWDEPAFKARFQLTLTLPAGLLAVSNMPAARVTAAGAGMQRVVFGITPRMSTYLVAVAAGNFGRLQAAGGGTPIDLWAPEGSQAQGAYALQAASVILPYYNAYFGARYPLPKLSLIAIPNNYEAGAMENWGAITFIDDALLFDPKTSAPRTREEIYLTVAHEMAHQWTGDLVTMGWWDNIWLNEGFATWMETKATDHFNPDWEVWPRQHEGREDAMAEDAQPTTHPIQQPIDDISAANAAFDDISYQKGEQVIRMIEQWLGPDVFRDGMRLYIRRHAYGSSTSADLWNALQRVSHQNVAAVGTVSPNSRESRWCMWRAIAPAAARC
jgi:aminopeptidase N